MTDNSNDPRDATAAPEPTPSQPLAEQVLAGQGAPRRRGLPKWAWALIAAGAVVLIGMIVLGAVLVNSVVSAVQNPAGLPTPAATAPASTDAASPAPSATPAPSTSPAPGGTDGALIGLDEYAELGATPPIWGYPIIDGWEITIFDQAGVNQSLNAELGCQFTSSQNRQPAYDTAATSDRSDTEASTRAIEQQMLGSIDTAEVTGQPGSTDIGVNLADGADRLEFLTTRVDYVNPQVNESYTNEVAVRAMPQVEAFMYLVVSCPTALVEAGDSPFDELVAGSAVIFE